jgi:hypothetical protein
MSTQVKNIAGLSMKGGRNDRFIFCLIEHFPDQDRWFLKSLLQSRDEEGRDGDQAIRDWIEQFSLKELVVDFPLSEPACQTCRLECPGAHACPDSSVVFVKNSIEELIETDRQLQEKHPKEYERRRVQDLEIDPARDVLAKEAHHHLLSRPFKRRLKKGYLPYWNRPIDFWIWSHYYDQLLELFNLSFDSFGTSSLMIQSRFTYLKRHFPNTLKLFESSIPILLIELFRSGILQKRDLLGLNNLELGAEARLDIIKKIEKSCNLFIYDRDLEALVENPRAFDSFLLAVIGQNIHLGHHREVPEAFLHGSQFVVPSF